MGKVKQFIKDMYYPDPEFYKTVLALAIPVLLQNLITIGVNITDTMMLGMLGETQLSASSLATQFINMFQSFTMGISMGASIMVSRYWGMKKTASMKKAITIMVRMILLFATIFAALTLLIPREIMRMYTSDEEIISEGVRYLNYAVLTFYLHGLSLGSSNVLKSVGKVKLPMYVSMVSFVMNIFGNYVLMFGKMGLPAMGIAGASLSTLIVRVIECLINFGYLIVCDREIGYRFKDLFMKTSDLLSEYIKIGLPVVISDGFMTFGNNTIMMIVGRMGAAFVSANAVASVVQRMVTAGVHGVGSASSTLTGKSLGEGDTQKVMRQGPAFVGIGILLGLFAGILILLLINPVVLLYNLQGAAAENCRALLRASAILVVFSGGNGILTKGMLRGGGDTKMLIIADSIFTWIVGIPLGYLAGLVLGIAPFWVYLCLHAEQFCKFFWAIHRMQSGKWIKKIKAVD